VSGFLTERALPNLRELWCVGVLGGVANGGGAQDSCPLFLRVDAGVAHLLVRWSVLLREPFLKYRTRFVRRESGDRARHDLREPATYGT